MQVNGHHQRTIQARTDGRISIIDQTCLPQAYTRVSIQTSDEMARAIRNMQVRGAPLIGAAAAWGVALAMAEQADDESLAKAIAELANTRPTAVNLHWALKRMQTLLQPLSEIKRAEAAWKEAQAISDEDVASNRAIGETGAALIEELAAEKSDGEAVNILTHCNAGWLGTVDYGTALAPIWLATERGLKVHVWVDETRPRCQGALTAWELRQQGIPHTVIVDNAGGHLMQQGKVDVVIVGCDRVAANGDVANKIGTYLKALAARDNNVPFFVAVPTSTIDWDIESGEDILIEERNGDEVRQLNGVEVYPSVTEVSNPGFDITRTRLITGYISERGLLRKLSDLDVEETEPAEVAAA